MPVKSDSNCLKLQADFDAAAKWEEDWLLAFHPDKCNVLSVTTEHQPLQNNYTRHNHILETHTVTSAKYLGITIKPKMGQTHR